MRLVKMVIAEKRKVWWKQGINFTMVFSLLPKVSEIFKDWLNEKILSLDISINQKARIYFIEWFILNNIDVCFMNTMSVKNKKLIKQKLPHGSIDWYFFSACYCQFGNWIIKEIQLLWYLNINDYINNSMNDILFVVW